MYSMVEQKKKKEKECVLTKNFNFDRLATIELSHTLNLSKRNIISTLEAMTSFIQTCHDPCTVLGKPKCATFQALLP